MFLFNRRHNQKQKITLSDRQLLTNKRALVTGAGGLIGRAIVATLIEHGAEVIGIDKDEKSLTRLTRDTASTNLTTQQIDLTHKAQINDLNITQIDILIHAAGIQVEKSFGDETDQDWEKTLNTNIMGPVWLTQKFLPMFKSQKTGSIIMITSVHQNLPSRWSAYSTSKSAQSALVQEWAVDLAPYGVRVNGIAPGWVSDQQQTSKLALLHQQTIPPEFIARTALYLSADYYSYFTTGTTITIDAGMSLYSGRVPFDLPNNRG